MELADFPHLRKLYVSDAPVTGDIRHIQEDDFSAAERVVLPDTVIGGRGDQFQRIRDVPSFMQAIHPLLKCCPKTFNKNFVWFLSKDSPDWYVGGGDNPKPPFQIGCGLAGGLRCGWRRRSGIGLEVCEVNWLDPEPSEDSEGYELYAEFLQKTQDETHFYRGYSEPPTEEEYSLLCLHE